ncbi:MAG: hypothetical protein ABR500_02535 [Dermatophilaceae bacterium]
MTRPALLRRVAVAAALGLAVTLTACSGDDPGELTTTASPTPTASPTETATSTATDSPTATPPVSATATDPAETTAPGQTPPAPGSDAERLAELLPEGFPIPPELTITGDPTSTADNANVSFTVPSGAEVFDFYKAELPEAGYEFLPGTSDSYSTEVASGAIIARGNGYDLNLLVVEDDVVLTLTRTQ